MPLVVGNGAGSATLAEMVSVARRNVENTPAWPSKKAAACWQNERFMATLQLATMLDAVAAHSETGSVSQTDMEVEAVALYAEAEAAGEALLVEKKLSPWGSNGDRAAMVAKEHLSVQLREQARPFARAKESNPMYLFRNVPLPQLSSYYEHPSYFSNRSHFHMVERARDGKALFFLGPANSGAYPPAHRREENGQRKGKITA